MRRLIYAGVIPVAFIVAFTMAGCSSTAAPEPVPTNEQPMLSDQQLTDLLPTSKEYTDFNSGLAWAAKTEALPSDQLAQIKFGGNTATAVDFGEECAAELRAAFDLPAKVVDAAVQDISTPDSSEHAYLLRYGTVDEAKQVLESQAAISEECSANQGTATFTQVEMSLDDSVAYSSRLPSTDDSFVGFARKADLLIFVENDSDDGAVVGPATLELIANYLSDKAL